MNLCVSLLNFMVAGPGWDRNSACNEFITHIEITATLNEDHSKK